ncbi:peroxidase [Bombyx mori]|uniref:Peroxidase n=2 Tax=Bombyx mori TaxID=7091 RepID=A0A8R1WMD2_BOMMO|nr:peroxidase-like isoform X1 [Bombyx mori]
MIIFVFLSLFAVTVNCIFYDSYTGNVISKDEVKQHDKANNTFWCVGEFEPCDPNEGRRVDGSCNNLQHPTRGASHTPFVRVLPAVYDKDFEPKTTKSGNAMPTPRYLRTSLWSVGKVSSQLFTQLAIHDFVFMSADVVSLHDTVKYILWKPYCCTAKGKTDRDCVQNKIPDDDPVHRFSDIRCLNMTRPESFQSTGCVKNGTVPERIVSSTPLIDLSMIYGSVLKSLLANGRLFKGGLLKYENSNGRIWPPSTKSQANLCFLNDKPRETRCHATPDIGSNTLASVNLMSIWFWRHHNFIAEQLAKINPCWDDNTLFNTARDINIAVALQIYLYELLPLFLGRDNLVRDGVLSPSFGYRDAYNPEILPQVSLEYPFVLRWLHSVQEGTLKMYDTKGYYLKQYPIVNLTLRTGFFDVDNNIDYITQGAFRQGSANIDHTADPDIVDIGLGPHQRASDLMTNDISKNRYFGFQPYVKYHEFCFGKTIKKWGDLEGVIDPERIEILKDLYEDVEDMDLLAGIWVERRIKGGFVPPTFYCLVVEQLVRNIVSDRHWYESSKRPNAFSLQQLFEIRKASIARILCDVGDKVTEIQPQAFLRPHSRNRISRCENIPGIDFTAWKDFKCNEQYTWQLVNE